MLLANWSNSDDVAPDRCDMAKQEMGTVLLFMVYIYIGDEIHKLYGDYFINHEMI